MKIEDNKVLGLAGISRKNMKLALKAKSNTVARLFGGYMSEKTSLHFKNAKSWCGT